MKLLIIEDDALLSMGLEKALIKEAYVCDCVSSVKDAEAYLAASGGGNVEGYSAILLDLGLPDGNGIELLQRWRRQGVGIPVLIMTARDALDDRVEGLDAGADDYLIKPFELLELVARLRAIIRRHQGQSDNVLCVGDLALDLAHKCIKQDEQLLELTPREYAVLSRLMLKQGQVVHRETLQQDLYTWQDSLGSNTLEVYIHHLRQKIGKARILTQRGVGYSLTDGRHEPA
ncbi:MAG: response regulator [Neisseriaceae bacterium]